MKIKNRFRLKLAKMLNIKFESVTTDKATLHYDGELEVGSEVFEYDEEGNLLIPEDGVYETEDKTITVEDGIVTAIEDKIEEEPEPTEEPVEMEEETENVENSQLARIETLESQLQALVEIIKELVGTVDEVSEEVEVIDEEFRKVAKIPLKKPIQKQKFTKNKLTIEDRFMSAR